MPRPLYPRSERRPKKRWVKLSAFVAQLTQEADISYESPLDQGFNYHPLDRSHRAAWTFQFALENDDVPTPTLSRIAAMEATCMWCRERAMTDMNDMTVMKYST